MKNFVTHEKDIFMKKKRIILLLFLIGIISLISVVYIYRNISKTKSKNLSIQELQEKLTPEVRRCIIAKLGWREAQELAQEIRKIRNVSTDALSKISSCFETDLPPDENTIPDPLVKKNGSTSVATIKLIADGVKTDISYWLYENTKYPCGKEGNHEFLVVQKNNTKDKRNLFVRFHGGLAGFFLKDGSYYPEKSFINILYAQKERNTLFDAAFGDGVTKLIRENTNWRILVPSYCSHDFYIGKGQYHAKDGFARVGYLASRDAIDFVSREYPTNKLVTSGSSAGTAGAFYHGYQRKNVVGIIMDSGSMDLTALVQNYEQGNYPLSSRWPAYCDGAVCIKTIAERIGFNLGNDEPHLLIQRGLVKTPIYLIWDKSDVLFNHRPEISMQNLTNALKKYNPGGKSLSKEACLNNPATPNQSCTIHSVTKYDGPDSQTIYNWILSLLK